MVYYSAKIFWFEVSHDDYLNAISISEDRHIGVNGAIGYVLMKKETIHTIYSFDKDFDAFTDISRIIE